jgi:hypothetical protein
MMTDNEQDDTELAKTENVPTTTPPKRRLIGMFSLYREDGSEKTDEELADEVWQAHQASMRAEQEDTDFERVPDLRPELE